MCGIIGQISLSREGLGRISDFEEGMSAMAYRGPDAQKVWHNPANNVRLGHLRLSILDLREAGAQPMHASYSKGGYTIVFNGEVYNYLEIRAKLIQKGYTFTTGTDTEVILAAYDAYGEDCLEQFNGMFAIVIYHHDSDTFFFARDRLGIKPLYYAINDDHVVFASEIKAIRHIHTTDNRINEAALCQYMRYGYSTGEETMEPGVLRLLPGHKMTLERAKSAQPVISRWWSVSREPVTGDDHRSDLTARNELEALLKSAVSLRLRSDVPVGVFLSGGLDSSAVVAMLAKQSPKQIKTYSVRYDLDDYGEQYDESHYAQMIADKFNTDHHVYTMTAEDFISYIPEFVRKMDEPVTEAAAISLHYVSEMAKRDGVTVVLSGEGADEILAGYQIYRNMSKIESLHQTITSLGARLLVLAAQLLPAGNKVRKYASMTAQPFEDRYRGVSVYDPAYIEKLYAGAPVSLTPSHEKYAQEIMASTKDNTLLSRMLDYDTRTWLADDLLIKADRMSMGSSLELRVPFLDYRLVEFAAGLPDRLKIRDGEGKYLLKKVMEEYLPPQIVYREKRGFPTPLSRMFKGPLSGYVTEKLIPLDAPIRQLFNGDVISAVVKDHLAGRGDHHRILWQLLVLNEWLAQRQEKYQHA